MCALLSAASLNVCTTIRCESECVHCYPLRVFPRRRIMYGTSRFKAMFL